MDKHTCLDILGLDETATKEDIKKAYKSIALKTHPDKLTNLDDEEREEKELQFKEVSEAYQRLMDNNFTEDILNDLFEGFGEFEGGEGLSSMFGGSSGMKMFGGMASKLFQSGAFQGAFKNTFQGNFQSIFKASVTISYYDLIYKRKVEKDFNLCGIPTKAVIDCSKFPRQQITRTFNGLSSTADIEMKLEETSEYQNEILSNGKVNLIYNMDISHYDYYKGFNHSFTHLDGTKVTFKSKKMSRKILKIKGRGLNGGDLLIKLTLFNPNNKNLEKINKEDYDKFLDILNALCNDKC